MGVDGDRRNAKSGRVSGSHGGEVGQEIEGEVLRTELAREVCYRDTWKSGHLSDGISASVRILIGGSLRSRGGTGELTAPFIPTV